MLSVEKKIVFCRDEKKILVTCFYLVGLRRFSQISEPLSVTSHFLRELFPVPHSQPPRALIWELLLSAACSVLLPAYLLLTQKGHCQLLISLKPTDLPETSTISALSPLLSFLLILLRGEAFFTVCNFTKLKNWSTIYYAHWVATLTFSWTLFLSTELLKFGVMGHTVIHLVFKH